MKKIIFLYIAILCTPLLAQIERDRNQASDTSPYSVVEADTIRRRPLQGETRNDSVVYVKRTLADYQFWTDKTAREIVDTTLTIDAYYNQNFIGKDLFAKMQFPNIGQTLSALEVYDKPFQQELLPTGKRFNYLYADAIRYFDVKTPMTQFVYENGVREGNYLSSLFTHNLNSQFNYAVQYRGLRSRGLYQRSLASNNAFVLSSNYHTKDKRLNVWGHFATQNIDNEENFGIQDIDDFIEAEERNLTNAANVAVNLNNTTSKFDSRRYFLAASYGILPRLNPTDSTSYYAVKLANRFTFENQKYKVYSNAEDFNFLLNDQNPLVSNVFFNEKELKSMSNVTTAGFQWSDKLTLDAGVKFQNLRLEGRKDFAYFEGYQSYVPSDWEENLIGVVGDVHFDWNERLKLRGELEFLQSTHHGSLYKIDAALDVSPLREYTLTAGILARSNIPSLNLIYNQNALANFNYYNDAFDNVNTQKLYGILSLDRLKTQLEAAVYHIGNQPYLDRNFIVQQLDDNINYFKIRGRNHLQFQQFNLVSTIQYQKVTNNEAYLPLPDFIVRETLYWQGKVFEGKAELQTGVSAYYFTSYDAQGFFPLINEFYLQDEATAQKIGGYPIVDLFLNAKVRNMRFYIRGDHLNALFGKRNYFSVPGVPYRGFKIQLGLKWNIFS
ncbi:putative porin [Vaginella massiliensis]|uniref:putative porin n=1 Tax=Vaginella massiliensis TaxID=1816680 RepID=UPI0008386C9A|nr:putative porin [Vaginella massiliensis]